MKRLFELFLTFFKIGLFTFGGGYAMISIIDDTCVERKKWITEEEMKNLVVIAESTPGPVAINCATFVGYKKRGITGALFATFGMVLPSFIIIYVISLFLNDFLEIKIVADAFNGIKAAVGVLILGVGIKMVKNTEKKAFPITVFSCAFIIMMLINIFSLNISSVTLLLVTAVMSIFLCAVKSIREKKGGKRNGVS